MSGFIFFFLICDNVEKVQLYNSFKRVCKPLYFDENRFANIVIIYMIKLIYINCDHSVSLACWSVFFARNAVLCTQATVVPLRRLVVTPNKSRHRQDLWQASSGGLNNEERWYVQVSCVYRFFLPLWIYIYIYLWQNMKWKPQICTRQRKMLKDMKYV